MSACAASPSRSAPRTAALQELAALPNLGPKSAEWLVQAGVTSVADMRRLGAVGCYVKVQRQQPKRLSLNLLWALEGALSGLPWQTVAREHRTSLLLALEHLQRQQPANSGQALPLQASQRPALKKPPFAQPCP